MGYFKTPLRRRSARADKHAFIGAAADVDPSRWTDRFDLRALDRQAYLRFVTRGATGGFVGLFRGSVLLDDVTVPEFAQSLARGAFDWFNRHLAVPRGLPQEAVCWFRSDAAECVDRLRALVEAYRVVDRTVWMLTARRPGRIVYVDRHQVAAVPFADARVAVTTR